MEQKMEMKWKLGLRVVYRNCIGIIGIMESNMEITI